MGPEVNRNIPARSARRFGIAAPRRAHDGQPVIAERTLHDSIRDLSRHFANASTSELLHDPASRRIVRKQRC